MKSKLFAVVTVTTFLFSGGYVLAHEGAEHDEHMESKQNAMMETTPTASAIEVGNTICPVSKEKVPQPGEKTSMGGAAKFEYKGKIYNLCCPMCVKDFKKDPEKYSKIAEKEVKEAKEKPTWTPAQEKKHR